MQIPTDLVISVIVAILGSTGLWTFINKKIEDKSASRRMILGLGYRELTHACREYIDRGWISLDEYEDLNKYLYLPYIEMGGNGTAQALMEKVKKLPNNGGDKQ